MDESNAEEERDALAELLDEALKREGEAESRVAELEAFVRWTRNWCLSQRPVRQYSLPIIERCEALLPAGERS